MENKYLEKIAITRLKKWDAANGNLGAGMSSAQLNTKFTGASPAASVASGAKTQVNRLSMFPSFGKKTIADGTTKLTGDATVTGKSLASRLADKKSGAFVPATGKVNIPGLKPPSPKGAAINAGKSAKGFGGKLLGKAMAFAKRTPLGAAAAIGGVGFLAGRATSSNNNQGSY